MELKKIAGFEDSNTSKETTVKSKKSNKLTYDTAFKNFFKRKAVLAIILKEIVPEFRNMEPKEIEKYIKTSEVNRLNAETYSEEDTIFGSKILYDVVIQCLLPQTAKEIPVCIIFDLEMQRRYNMPYDVIDRAAYYASRLLAREAVVDSKYDELPPVYSTWVCLTGIPVELQNTAHHFELTDHTVPGIKLKKSLINIDLLLLSENYDWDTADATIIKFLQAIFKNKLDDSRFNKYLPIDSEIEEEVQTFMAEQSQYEYERQVDKAESRAEGRAEGIEEGIVIGVIKTALSMGVTDVRKIAQIIEQQTKLTYSEALDFIRNHKDL